MSTTASTAGADIAAANNVTDARIEKELALGFDHRTANLIRALSLGAVVGVSVAIGIRNGRIYGLKSAEKLNLHGNAAKLHIRDMQIEEAARKTCFLGIPMVFFGTCSWLRGYSDIYTFVSTLGLQGALVPWSTAENVLPSTVKNARRIMMTRAGIAGVFGSFNGACLYGIVSYFDMLSPVPEPVLKWGEKPPTKTT